MAKRLLVFAIVLGLAQTAWAGGRLDTPIVKYIEPKNDSVVDLAGKGSITFAWKSSPTPGSGRMAYKFNLYKGFGYEVVFGKKLEHDIYMIEVPSDLLEDGAQYSWQVLQRDAKTRIWSRDYRWSFRVKK